jgi:hypothetical protein
MRDANCFSSKHGWKVGRLLYGNVLTHFSLAQHFMLSTALSGHDNFWREIQGAKSAVQVYACNVAR